MLQRLKKAVLPQQAKLPLPVYGKMEQRVEALCYPLSSGAQWYLPVMLSAQALAQKCFTPEVIAAALALLQTLEKDDYTSYLINYYSHGIQRFDAEWNYADIVTVLIALSGFFRPINYLEIGVRRGRSVCAVASRAPACNLYMFDLWIENYAGMANPGVDLVNSELDKVGHVGQRKFHNGNSHQTLKQFFHANPDMAFDMITVDGDHSYLGAAEDLTDVLPHLKIGGAIVFDDICHPKHLYLRKVWDKLVVEDPRFSTWSCQDVGYGVSFALRKW